MLKKHKRLVFIGTRNDVLEQANQLGIEAILIQKREHLRSHHYKLADRVYVLDTHDATSIISLIKRMHQESPLDGVVSFVEEALITAAQCEEMMGIKRNSVDTVKTLQDKGKMRSLLQLSHFPSCKYRIGSSIKDLYSFPFPFIVKPLDGNGSRDVFVIKSRKDLESLAPIILEKLPTFLLEEYLRGIEVSVESFSFNGKHMVLAITDKVLFPNFVERGHAMPSLLPSRVQYQIIEYVKSFLDLVGLQEGPSHTELFLTPEGPRIVESHNRLGGDKINELYKYAYGENMLTLFLAWTAGIISPWLKPPRATSGAAIRFFAPAPGRVLSISGIERVSQDPSIPFIELKLNEQDTVTEIFHSFDRVGCLIATGENTEDAVTKAESAVQDIKIITEPVRENRI
ncbi:ATP-grasp domain-containing protein [Mechercharimyces sp. CAU 1602]|uniref:ATP-grasp domain-containing protein n=1 Tax=Mechercharimyces sp. CAU 1602 TaxID=2973933 RepID=UPI0021628423|nr:ATP-grasp domain-containing protein [Mechercharimyces sp. CAU 1602]MCS1352616.1 ATP-grasp domain-containing protein [Mechercharimyces sp. CAU 1602]